MIRTPSQQRPCIAESPTRVAKRAPRRIRNGVVWLLVVLGYLLHALPLAQAQHPISMEYKIKIAYIYKCTHFITWPDSAFASADAPFVIAVLGDDPFGASLDKLQMGRRAAGRPIVVRRFTRLKDVQPTHVLFVSRSTPFADVKLLLNGPMSTHPTLVVGESTGLADAGTPVNFYLDVDGTVGFEVNVDAIARRGLRADAKFLSIARVIRDKPLQP